MNDESILKRTLVLTGKLVGIFSMWVALLSVVATVAATRLVAALSGSTADQGAVAPADATKKDEGGAASRPKNPPINAAHKPNG